METETIPFNDGVLVNLGHYEQGIIARALLDLEQAEPGTVPVRLHGLFNSQAQPASVVRWNEEL